MMKQKQIMHTKIKKMEVILTKLQWTGSSYRKAQTLSRKHMLIRTTVAIMLIELETYNWRQHIDIVYILSSKL